MDVAEHAGMDQLSAHLDRGWALVSSRDFAGARLSAGAVLSLAPDHPEGLTLIGLAELGEGDPEAALEAFDAAMELDPEYLAPVLYGAEAAAADPDRLPEALERLQKAYELVEPGSPEEVDTVLLHVDLLLGSGDEMGARAQLARLSPPRVRENDQRIQLGRLALRLEDESLAEELLAPLRKETHLSSEAVYALAQLAELQGAYVEALARYMQVRTLDLERLPALRLPSAQEVIELTRSAMDRLPEELHSLVKGAELRVRDLPAEELVADGLDPWMPLLVTGPPLPPGALPGGPRVFHVFVYRANLRLEGMDAQARLTLLAEHLRDSLERFGE